MTLKNLNLKCKYLYLPFDIEGSAILAQTNITVIDFENSTLTCHVWGIPVPSVSWTEVIEQGTVRKGTSVHLLTSV